MNTFIIQQAKVSAVSLFLLLATTMVGCSQNGGRSQVNMSSSHGDV